MLGALIFVHFDIILLFPVFLLYYLEPR